MNRHNGDQLAGKQVNLGEKSLCLLVFIVIDFSLAGLSITSLSLSCIFTFLLTCVMVVVVVKVALLVS